MRDRTPDTGEGDRTAGLSRRAVLGAVASAGALALAGCSGLSARREVEPVWQQSLPDASATGPPAATDGHVVVGAQDRSLHAFAAEDGTPAFSVETGGPIEARPAVPATGGPFHAHSTDGDLYTVGTDGERLWHEEGRSSRGRVVRTGSLVVRQDPTTDVVRGYDARSGTVRFEREPSGFLSPTLAGSVLPLRLGSTRTRLVVFDPADGSVLWETEPRELYPPVAATEDQVVVVQGRTVRMRRARDGAVQWRTELDADIDPLYRAPVWFGRDAYIRVDTGSDGANTLVALDREDGSVRWRRSAGYEIEGVAPASEAVYVASSVNDPDGGVLVRVDRFAPDGSRRWQVTTDLQIGGTIQATGRLGEILFVASDNEVLALDPADGSRRWRYEPERGLSVATDGDALYVSSRNAGGVARLPTT